MYLYFNREGILKEVINDKALRQGSVNVNKIYVYIEELDTSIPQNFFVNYRLPDGTKIPEFQQEFLAIPTADYMEVPYNPRRDLKFFKYSEKYPFYEIPLDTEIAGVQYNALSQYGSVALTLRVGSLDTLGLVVFNVEESADGEPEIHWDEYISLAQFNYLLSLLNTYYSKEQVEEYIQLYINTALASKVDKTNIGNKIYATDPLGEQTTLTYSKDYFDYDAIVQRQSNGQLSVPQTPIDNYDATSKEYVDNQLATKQDRLVSGTNIKTLTVDGVEKSLLGSGTIEVGTGGGSVEVDDELSTTSTNPVENRVITNELYNVRAELLGKSNSLSLSYTQTAPTSSNITDFKKFDGTPFVDMADFNAYVNGLILGNSDFNTQEEALVIDNSKYIIDIDNRVVRAIDIKNNFKLGQFNIYITQTGIPDRWFTYQSDFPSETGFVCVFYPLETEKVDLSGYATKTELSDSIKNLAQPYDSTTIYSIGDKVIYDSKLYSCLVNMSVAESWDSTHWVQITVASGFVDLDKAQVITGVKTISNENELRFGTINENTYFYIKSTSNKLVIGAVGLATSLQLSSYLTSFVPTSTTQDLGTNALGWRDIHLTGKAYIGTANIYTSNTNIFFQLTNGTDAFAMYSSAFVGVGGNKSLGTNATRWDTVWANSYRIGGSMTPTNNNTSDLGNSSNAFKNLYLSGEVVGASNVFNVINANDIVNNTLTQAQYDLITNGKPTLISGTYRGWENCLLVYSTPQTSYVNGLCLVGGTGGVICGYRITRSTLELSINNGSVYFYNIGSLNGKTIPAYPSNTGTFVLKCVNGTLTWVAE